jgi:hypothetical protein
MTTTEVTSRQSLSPETCVHLSKCHCKQVILPLLEPDGEQHGQIVGRRLDKKESIGANSNAEGVHSTRAACKLPHGLPAHKSHSQA